MNPRRWFKPRVLAMRGYVPGEQPVDPRVVKLNTNESPYPPPRVVLQAVHRSANALLRKYPQPTSADLRRRISKAVRWPVDGILVGNGSDEILSMLFRACVGPGDLVQYPDVTYSLYPVLNSMEGGKARTVRLDDSFDLPFDRFSGRARLTLFAYPNPPLGNCFDRRKILGFCRRVKGLVLIDEAYVDFADQDCLSIARRCPNVIVLRTLSKSFSLAGARLGYALAHPKVVGQLMKVKDSYNVNRVTQAVGKEAFSPAGLAGMSANVKLIRRERSRLTEALRRLGFTVPESQANFVTAFVPDPRRKGGAEGLYRALKKRGILVRYFPHPRLKRALRITVGSRSEDARLLREMKRLVSGR
jgi:histidinol-phosphate aminotransferase